MSKKTTKKNQKGGMNRLSLLKTGRSIKKSGKNIKSISHGKKSKVSRKSPLVVNSNKRYELTIIISGNEKIEEAIVGKTKKKNLKYSIQEYTRSGKKKKITTEVKPDEKLNDILRELNKITKYNLEESIYWDKVNLRSEDPTIADIIIKPQSYRFIKTTMRYSLNEGDLAELYIKTL